ncbi:hypothetical protein GMA12_17540 [Kocuria sediminis]|uniref:Uncharacterized protein n=1 Tax=Kocuria sediminis TaxID=1038857 RepID=A0A6N8GPB8_9MICC|nr:hypothetical protein [Kocuria sediminis]MUN64921.1 hypothetical protein [Kocuria sediminis]
MMINAHRQGPRRWVIGAALSVGVALTTGCGETEPTDQTMDPTASAGSPTTSDGSSPPPEATGADGADSIYTGPFDAAFRAELSDYTGEQVTLTGEISDLIRSRSSYLLASPADPGLDPLLVSARYAVPEVEAGTRVEVTGIVREEFAPPVEEKAVEAGEEAGFYDRHVGEPYLDQAQVVATGASAS